MNKTLLAAVLVAVLVVAGGVLLIWKLQPSMQEQQEQALTGAVREGSAEFDTLTRRVIAETDEENTWQSPVGTGGIMMNIAGRLRNNSDKVISGLEINVSVVDITGKVVKEKSLVVVPTQKKTLAPKEQMNVNVRIDGFRQEDDRANIRWKVTAIKVEK